MARTKTSGSKPQTQSTPVLDALVVEYNQRKVAIRRVADYPATLVAIKRSVRALAQVNTSDIVIKCNTLPEQEGEYVDISEDAWPDLVFRTYIKKLVVEIDTPADKPVAPAPSTAHAYKSNLQKAGLSSPRFSVTLSSSSGEEIEASVRAETKISTMRKFLAATCHGCEDRYYISYDGNRTRDHDTMEHLGVEEGDTLDWTYELVGGKPVIYLSPPESGPSIEATVELSLSASWSLSALYPISPGSTRVNSSYGQNVTWTVRASPDGVLYDKATEAEVSYLYWEATTNPAHPISPPASPRSTPPLAEFDPSRAELSASDSVLLPVDKVSAYLDRALAALTLHTEARTSFITYWLPSLLKHEHVALRFVPQIEYEYAARLTIKPAPDVVTRVFMVFCGIKEEGVPEWRSAVERAGEDVMFWQDIVGIDANVAQDTSLFRVLEWGGMEVLHH